MNRQSQLTAMFALAFAVSCGGTEKTAEGPVPEPAAPAVEEPSSPPAAADTNVQEGDGWTRVSPGVWAFSIDQDGVPDMSLSAFDGGRGLERIDLPKGATRAKLTTLRVNYTSPGALVWTVVKDAGQRPSDAPEDVLGEVDATVQADQVGLDGAAPRWVDHAMGGIEVTGSFWVVFTTSDEPRPAVGGVRGMDSGRLLYQPAGSTAGPVPHMPLVRVVLEGVEG